MLQTPTNSSQIDTVDKREEDGDGWADWTVLIEGVERKTRGRGRGRGEGTFLKCSSVLRQLATADNHKTTGALEVWVLHG